MSFSWEELLAYLVPQVKFTLWGEIPGGTKLSLAPSEEAKEGSLVFVREKTFQKRFSLNASVILVPLENEERPSEHQVFLKTQNPEHVFNQICRWNLTKKKEVFKGIHPTAVVDPAALIDKDSYVGPYCIIEKGCRIGANSILQAQVYLGAGVTLGQNVHIFPRVSVLEDCTLGNNVIVHSGVVIGADGFGYENQCGRIEKIPQIGRVVIEDEVEIGANTTIDRARLGETRIGQGTKIDNLVQISHNVKIGRCCLICAQVGIAGSSILGDHVLIGGQAGIADHITIADAVKIGGLTGVNKSLSSGAYRGIPVLPYQEAQRLEVYFRRLPELFERLQRLEKQGT